MKATELRIGNLVYGFGEFKDTAAPVCSLHSDNTLRLTILNQSVGCFSAELIQPILLTEEWLVKMGFELINTHLASGGNYYMYMGVAIDLYVDKGEMKLYYFTERVDRMDFDYEIKYVHQLQNLYFALNGEELEIEGQK
jgi:hypothetical protein